MTSTLIGGQTCLTLVNGGKRLLYCPVIDSMAMNLGILEGLQAHGASGDTTCMEMLPGNHKDEWPLIHFVPTSHTLFVV